MAFGLPRWEHSSAYSDHRHTCSIFMLKPVFGAMFNLPGALTGEKRSLQQGASGGVELLSLDHVATICQALTLCTPQI